MHNRIRVFWLVGLIALFCVAADTEESGYTLRIRNSELGTVLSTISMEAGYTLVMEKGVDPSQSVNADVNDATLDEVLIAVLSPFGYSYKVDNRFLRIKSTETRVFLFNFVPIVQTMTSNVGGAVITQSGGGGGGGGSAGGGGAGGGGAGGGGGGSSGGGGGIQGTYKLDAKSQDDDVWKQLEKIVKGAASEDALVTVDRASGYILVTDNAQKLDVIDMLLRSFEKSLHKQVVIEAKVVEITLSKGSQYGIDITRALGPKIADSQGTISQFLNPGGTEGFSATLTTEHNLDGVLQALQNQGNVNTLASPHLTVINGQTGFINVAESVNFVESSTTTISQGISTTSVNTGTVTTGVVLGVTPRVDEDGTILLHIVPIVSDLVKMTTFDTGSGFVNLPDVTTRATSTIVRIKPGDTLVISGLIQSRDSKQTKKTPLLGDIPGLGFLFQQRINSKTKTEIIVLVKPTIQDFGTSD